MYFNPDLVKKVVYGSYSDSTFTNVDFEKIRLHDDLVGTHRFTCNTFYQAIYYDADDNQTGFLQFEATEINDASCDSEVGEGDGDQGNDGNDCNICNAMNSIKDTINNSVGDKLETVINMTHLISLDIGTIKDELQTSLQPPTFIKPNNDNLIDNNRPTINKPIFEDNNIYYKDEGQAPIANDMPSIPDPEEWDGVDQADELSKDDELTKDDFTLDKELTKDDFTSDNELTKDEFTSDKELTKDEFTSDNELIKDEFTSDKELTKDDFTLDNELIKDKFTNTHNYNNTNNFNQNHFYNKTHGNEFLPKWQSN